jgi:outer membrane receptor for ferrienterochelin and colicins
MIRFLVLFFFINNIVFSQNQLVGYIVDKNQNPIIGALVKFDSSQTATYTDYRGYFELFKDSFSILKVSALGYQTQFYKINSESEILIELPYQSQLLSEINIEIKKPSTNISLLSTIKTETLGRNEFKKAACCNLSESFETNATVDVSFTDAVTGTKQIQILGLSGVYALISSENIPAFIGNNSVVGLDLVPGQWLESVQLVKGPGSVINGYQSITGQINTEYKSPWDKTQTFLNYYYDNERRHELNIIHNFKKDSVLAIGLFLQADRGTKLMDMNGDNFADNLIGDKLVAMTVWESFQKKDSKWFNKGGLKYVFLDKEGGQLRYLDNPYLIKKNNNRVEIWNKLAYFINPDKSKSIGLQTLFVNQNHHFKFGKNSLKAKENRIFNNLMYQFTSKNTIHQWNAGISNSVQFLDNQFNILGYHWLDINTGVFSEYTITPNEKLSIIAGLRYDYSIIWKHLVTPRVHFKYSVFPRGVIRLSAGTGAKTVNPLMENLGLYASNRTIIMDNQINDFREFGVSYGINYTQKWDVDYRPLTLSVDFYRTNFLNKMIVDMDFSPQNIHFYNSKNAAFANSFMVQLEWEVIKFLNFKTAYRFYDVQNQYQSIGWANVIFSPPHRYFVNLDFEVTKKIFFDCTLNWMGKTRLPFSGSNPNEYQWKKYSESFFTVHSQIRYAPSASWDFYFGANNILNYQQKNPIISESNTDSSFFDASIVWAPVFGRMIYFGFKWDIFREI